MHVDTLAMLGGDAVNDVAERLGHLPPQPASPRVKPGAALSPPPPPPPCEPKHLLLRCGARRLRLGTGEGQGRRTSAGTRAAWARRRTSWCQSSAASALTPGIPRPCAPPPPPPRHTRRAPGAWWSGAAFQPAWAVPQSVESRSAPPDDAAHTPSPLTASPPPAAPAACAAPWDEGLIQPPSCGPHQLPGESTSDPTALLSPCVSLPSCPASGTASPARATTASSCWHRHSALRSRPPACSPHSVSFNLSGPSAGTARARAPAPPPGNKRRARRNQKQCCSCTAAWPCRSLPPPPPRLVWPSSCPAIPHPCALCWPCLHAGHQGTAVARAQAGTG